MKYLIFVLMFMFGCAHKQETSKTGGTPINNIPEAWRNVKDAQVWTDATLEALDRLGAPLTLIAFDDSKEFCPKDWKELTRDDRRVFWLNMIAMMAKRESGNNPKTKYQENFKDGKGNYVVSRGLLQISIESSRSYRCGFSDEQEIHDPIKNLQCGVRIINKWADEDGRIAGKTSHWNGVARYWSVLRSTSRSYPIVRDYMRGLKVCSF